LDIETRIDLITRSPTEETVKLEELKQLLETNDHPVAYDGWEPSGLVHLGTGLICGYKMMDLIQAGIKFKAFLATWHGWINNKLGGDRDAIKKAANHFVSSWKALGVPVDQIEIVWPEEIYDDIDYWNKVVMVSREMTIMRGRRTMEIMGRTEMEARKISDLLYTPMQVADIFQMKVDICQLGLDQRKANMVAREVGPKLGLWKPVCVHHHILKGLIRPPVWPFPESSEDKKKAILEVKMSKSRPEGAIFVYDSPEEIAQKIKNSFAPPKVVEYNPLLDIVKYIVFREQKEFTVHRSSKFGGDITYASHQDLARDYGKGSLHPADLKEELASFLIKRLKPAREALQRDPEAREIVEFLKSRMES